jgi:hypothetical protein
VLDGYHLDAATVIVDAVDHPVVAVVGTVRTLQPEPEWLAYPVPAGRQRPIQELRYSRGDLFGQPGQCPAARSGPRDGLVSRS